MNSDKFDRVVLDLMYGELDELTTLAAERHMQQSPRAREIFAQYQATRSVCSPPLHSLPPQFESDLLKREQQTVATLPLHHRLGRLVSMLAGYAMRPQLIMAALLLLMIGGSLMLVRARPGQYGAVQVTGEGAPEDPGELLVRIESSHASGGTNAHGVVDDARAEPAKRSATQRRAGANGPFIDPTVVRSPKPTNRPSPPAQSAQPPPSENDVGLDPFEQALEEYRAGNYLEARRRFTSIGRAGGKRSAEAALYAAQATRNISGCGAAVGRFDQVRLRFPGSGAAYEAAWRAARCLVQLGDVEGARQNYESLLIVKAYAKRAREGLKELRVGTVSEPQPTPAAKALLAKPGGSKEDDMPAEYLEPVEELAESKPPTAAGDSPRSGPH